MARFFLFISVLTVSIFGRVEARAAELCLDTLGAGKYCDQVVRAVESGQVNCLGYLYGTFDDNGACLKKLANTGKVSTLRVHLLNGPGLRNRALGSYEPHRRFDIKSFSAAVERGDPAATRDLIARARDVEEATRGKISKCFISGVLEHDLSNKAAQKVVDLLRIHAPSCRVVNNPLSSSAAVLPNTVHELHGEKPGLKGSCIVSLDGKRASSVDIGAYLRRFAHCEQVHIWDQELNCRTEGKFVDPRKRTACPTAQQFASLADYLNPSFSKASAPTAAVIRGCAKVLKANDGYKTGFVWKTADHPRPGKQSVTVFPAAERWDRVRFVSGGKVIDEPKFCGIANENRQHWCSNKLARQLPAGVIVQGIKGRQIACRVLSNPKSGRID